MISSIDSIHGYESFGMSFLSMRHSPAALSMVSSVGCILTRFVLYVACTWYVVVVSSFLFNVGGCAFVKSSISTVCMSIIFVSGFVLPVFFL